MKTKTASERIPEGFNYGGKQIYFVEPHGKDISFPRYRASLYYDGCLAMTEFFHTQEAYEAFMAEAKKHTFAEYADFREFADERELVDA